MSSDSLSRKSIVFDTSVLAHHGEAIHGYPGQNIYLPIEVLEELDNLKTRMDKTGSACRYVNRYLDSLREMGSLTDGVKLDDGQVIYLASFSDMNLLPSGMKDCVDNRIISVAAKLKNDGEDVVVISRDISLRVRCDSLDIKSEDYQKNATSEGDYFYDGLVTIETTQDVINQFYNEGFVQLDGLNLLPNQGVVLKAGQSSALAIAEDEWTIRKFHFASAKGFQVEGISARSKEQLFALEMLMDPEIHMVSITGMAGSGKAQPLYSKVLTEDGWVNMGDVVPGTKVVNPEGGISKVLEVFPQGEKDIYEITFSDGTSTRSCKEHLWVTKTQLDRDTNRNGSVKTLESIIDSLETGKDGRRNHSVQLVEPMDFGSQEKFVIDPYILGCILGERVSPIGQGERNELFKNELINEKLWGCEPSNKFIPERYKFSTIDSRLSLLQGLMDAEGTLSKEGFSTSFTSLSEVLAEDVADLVRSLGGKAESFSKVTTYTSGNKVREGRKTCGVRIFLPEGMNPFRVHKRADQWKPSSSSNMTKYIDDVSYIGKEKAQCIYLDSRNHLYVTDDFIVTHNTMLSIASAMSHLKDGLYKKLIISRPVQSTSKDIGFLPGTKLEKMEPWLQPIFDNLSVLYSEQGRGYIDLMMDKGVIEVEALTYVRGRTLPNTIFIIDEAQNITHHEAKALLTRMGENSKIILLGDLEQIDSPTVDQKTSGLSSVVELFKEFEHSGHVRLLKGERSKLASYAAKVM